MRRREFIAGLGAAAWPLTIGARESATPLTAHDGDGAPDSTEVTMEAISKRHANPGALQGNVYVSTYGETTVHSYLSPPDGLMVNT
jgi:hypothetical protein